MPKLVHAFPKLHQHASGHAFVKVDGQQKYLGRWGDPATREAYDRFVAEWLSHGRRMPPQPTDIEPRLLTINQLVDQFSAWFERRGVTKGRRGTMAMACRLLRELYGSTPAADFGPNKLRAFRAAGLAGNPNANPPRAAWSRTTANTRTTCARQVFKFAVSHELLPEPQLRSLATVEAIAKGEGKPAQKVMPVKYGDVWRTSRHLTRPVRGLITLQLLSAARGDEIVRLRLMDIDMSSDVWSVRITEHKTAHTGGQRVLYFGPRAQKALRPFLNASRRIDEPLFDPRESNAEAKRRGAKGSRRDGQPQAASKTDRQISNCYTTDSYRRAVARACKAAGVPPWSPHQLRHTAGTRARRIAGLDGAQAYLGHAHANVTERYAELDFEKARDIARRIG